VNVIESNYLALDEGVMKITQSQETIGQVIVSLKKEIDQLYAQGFKDSQFTALKKVVDDCIQELKDIQKQTDIRINELKEKSQLIKQYYAVSL
jgi:hypothetical protein